MAEISQQLDHPGARSVRVAVVSEFQLRGAGLRALLESQAGLEVTGTAELADVGEWISESRPDVMVVQSDSSAFLQSASALVIHSPGTRLLAVTSKSEPHCVAATLELGFVGYVVCSANPAQLIEAIRTVAAGETYLSPGIVQSVGAPRNGRKSDPALTGREIEVLTMVADGHSTKEIAASLKLSGKTIETHRLRTMRKLQLYSVAELTKYAIRRGLATV